MRILIVAALALAIPTTPLSARAQGSPITIPPDGSAIMINKTIGSAQWVISRDPQTGDVTGNVFTPGQSPSFLWCPQTGAGNGILRFDCYGAGPCSGGRCPDQWAPVGPVELPYTFFVAGVDNETGLQGLLGGWRMIPRFGLGYQFDLSSRYFLDAITSLSDGTPVIRGHNAYGDTIIAARAADLVNGSTLDNEFALLEIGSIICRFWMFDREGDLVGGVYFQPDSDGEECGSLGSAYGADGNRIAYDDEELSSAVEGVSEERVPLPRFNPGPRGRAIDLPPERRVAAQRLATMLVGAAKR